MPSQPNPSSLLCRLGGPTSRREVPKILSLLTEGERSLFLLSEAFSPWQQYQEHNCCQGTAVPQLYCVEGTLYENSWRKCALFSLKKNRDTA